MRKLLVGIDASQRSYDALRWAHGLAGAIDAGVTALVAANRDTAAAFGIDAEVSEDARAITEALEKRVADMGLSGIETLTVEGPPSAVLHGAASEADVIGVVIGTRGLGTVPGLLLGSVSRKLLFTCAHPLFLLPDRRSGDLTAVRRVLVAIDESAVSESVVEWSALLCAKTGAEAIVLRCVDPGSELPPGHVAGYLDEVRSLVDERWCSPLRAADVQYEVVAASGDPRSTILRLADDVHADLVVVSGRGAGQFQGLGGTTSHIVRHSRIPLAVVPCDPDWSPQEV